MNRKTIFLKTAFLLACLIAGHLTADAYTCEVDGIYYNISGGKATVTYKNSNFNSYSGEVVIPDTVHYNGIAYPVTSIGSWAFSYCSGLTSVTIPNSVTSIGSWAFDRSSGLTSVSIGNSVTTIGYSAFYGCSGLMSVTIPNSVTSIGSSAFEGCSGLTSMTIPNSVTSIGSSAFEGCSSLTSVTIPNSVTSIGSAAFEGCSSLTSVTIPNSVTTIGGNAFRNCSGMTSVTIGNSVTTIGSSAFDGCSSLARVDITNLESWCRISFDDYFESSNPLCYAHHLYLNGSEVTNLIIPNTITEINTYAFYGCSGLTSVTIPNSVITIGNGAFYGCSGLVRVDITDVESWCKISFGNSYSNPLYYAHHLYLSGTEVKNLIIPNSITKIYTFAFYGCSSLTSVTIPNSVTSIGNSAFYGCSSLTSVTIPNSVTSIGNSAFYGCSGLTGNLVIPNSVSTISSSTFSGCRGLTSVTIPNSVTSIGDYAFFGCSGLTSAIIGNSVTTIGYKAFYYCRGLTSVTIPNSVTTIGDEAFYNCSNLTSVTIGNSVITIGSEAFFECYGLTSVTIPNSVTTIGSGAFEYCRGLTSVTIPNSVTSIGNFAFYECYHLTSVAIVGDGEWVNANNGSLFQYAKKLLVGSGITAIRGLRCAPTEVWCNALVPPICDDNTFTSYSGALHVPAEAMVAYFTAEYWQNFYDLHTDGGGKVTLSQSEAALDLGETVQLNAVVNPAGSTLVWQSLNPDVATVNENGLVTAVGLGECDIIAHLSPNFIVADTCHVTVTPGEIKLTLSEESLTMEIGDETTLTLTIDPAGTTLTPVWTSSDESVAMVTDGGVVRAIGNGECDITATVLDKTVTCHVTVGGQVVITLDQTSVNVAVGSIVALYPTATPDVELELVVTSSDPTVAIARVVNRVNGAMVAPALVGTKMIQVIGIKDGRATITVGSADGSAIPATAIVTVGDGGSVSGDVDGDGNITIGDVTRLIDVLLNGGASVTENPSADVDGDGNITIGDVTKLIDMLLKGN